MFASLQRSWFNGRQLDCYIHSSTIAMFLIEFQEGSPTSHRNVLVKGEPHLIAISNDCVHSSTVTLEKVTGDYPSTVPMGTSHGVTLQTIDLSTCEWLLLLMALPCDTLVICKILAHWDVQILQDPWCQKACLLVLPPASSHGDWRTAKHWEYCQSCKKQVSDSLNPNSLETLNFAVSSKCQLLCSWKWQSYFVDF